MKFLSTALLGASLLVFLVSITNFPLLPHAQQIRDMLGMGLACLGGIFLVITTATAKKLD